MPHERAQLRQQRQLAFGVDALFARIRSSVRAIDRDVLVPAAAQAKRESQHGGGDAKRNHIGERIEIGAEHRLPLRVEARDVTIEHVAHERRRQQDERGPQEMWCASGEVIGTEED